MTYLRAFIFESAIEELALELDIILSKSQFIRFFTATKTAEKLACI